MSDPFQRDAAPEAVSITHDGAVHELRAGARVRLKPAASADVLDLALSGRDAVVVGIEQDLEDRVYLAVVLDDDPGRDLGMSGLPGHRFFFRPEEVEPR